MYGPVARCKTEFQDRRTWELQQCIRPLKWSDFAPGHHGYPRASRLTNGKASKGQIGTQSLGCAGQTVRPSLHSTSQTSAGKLSILSYSVSVLMFEIRGSCEAIPSEPNGPDGDMVRPSTFPPDSPIYRRSPSFSTCALLLAGASP